MSVCVSEVLHLLLRINPNSPIAPPSLVPLGLAAFSLPLATNVVVTTLIAARIWYLSLRNARNVGSAQFSTRTGQATIDIVVDSGMLYLVVQFVFVVLFAIGHPAQGIVGVIAVQIYVRIPSPMKGPEIRCKPVILAGHRADADSHPRRSWRFKYAERADSQRASIVSVGHYVVDASACQYDFVHRTSRTPSSSRRDDRI